MELHQVFLVVVDISGYTRFIRQHQMSLMHAEAIITTLMESVIDASEHPLTVNKLEGDAVLFYALSDRSGAAARDIFAQVLRFSEAFYARLGQLQQRSFCTCQGCTQMGQLDIKAVVHHGEAALKRVKQFEELAGEEVILVHRLLKNTIGKERYVLMSEPFFRLLAPGNPEAFEARTEQCEGIGAVTVFVHHPGAPLPIAAPASRWDKLRHAGLLHGYVLRRLLRLRRPAFSHLGQA